MEEFRTKSPVEVSIYLKEKGCSDEVCEIFEGEAVLMMIVSRNVSRCYSDMFPQEMCAPEHISLVISVPREQISLA